MPVKIKLYYREEIMAFKCMTATAPTYLSSQFLYSMSGSSSRQTSQLNISLQFSTAHRAKGSFIIVLLN
jgi:hypothetical protein